MPTFIDESGDIGHAAGSSSRYCLAAVWVPTQDSAATFREAIRGLRQRIGLPAGYEFKFARSHAQLERREAFIHEALRHEFRFAVACLDKQAEGWRDAERSGIYWACTVSLAALLRPTYRAEEARRVTAGRARPLNELVVVDDNEDRQFLAAVKRAFGGLDSGTRPGSPMIDKVKFRGSGPDDLLQLADLACGATAADMEGDGRWLRLIGRRCVGVLRIP